MQRFIFLLCLVSVGVIGWQVGGKLSGDAVAMAVGVLFGMMAGLPAAIMVIASRNQNQEAQPPHPAHIPKPPLAALPEPTEWRVVDNRQRIDTTVTAKRIEVHQ